MSLYIRKNRTKIIRFLVNNSSFIEQYKHVSVEVGWDGYYDEVHAPRLVINILDYCIDFDEFKYNTLPPSFIRLMVKYLAIEDESLMKYVWYDYKHIMIHLNSQIEHKNISQEYIDEINKYNENSNIGKRIYDYHMSD